MFRLDDQTDEGSQGIEERLRRGGLIRDEGHRTDCPPDPRATLQTSVTRINYFVEQNGHDAAEGRNSPPHLPASFTPIKARRKVLQLAPNVGPCHLEVIVKIIRLRSE
jgi:hypothetical protein